MLRWIFIVQVVSAQLVPRGGISTTNLRMVTDSLTGQLPSIMFGEADTTAFKISVTVHAENFAGNVTGWDNTHTSLVTQCAQIKMLGGYGKFSKGEIAKTFSNLGPHSHLRIKALFHFIDRWNGETAFMRANTGQDGSLVHVWTDRHTQDTSNGVNVCGSEIPEGKFAVPIEVVLAHSDETLRLGFGSTMEVGMCV
eukprot:Blabericola_migrator_1__6225@NODE_313_length_10046_cov_122_852390_g256_i0_p6_GENE_NODE_313_length_10046_cov_122_852390_g256_i0NODE_313_length_10046_cov_122_852390_g256_i0_p6_ORF_typecomplete_len196_score45_69_NODE_313_length_10046_cov_122_852390_g256_i043514938